jgi:hypothetical protein
LQQSRSSCIGRRVGVLYFRWAQASASHRPDEFWGSSNLVKLTPPNWSRGHVACSGIVLSWLNRSNFTFIPTVWGQTLLSTYCQTLLATYCQTLLSSYCQTLLATYCQTLLPTSLYPRRQSREILRCCDQTVRIAQFPCWPQWGSRGSQTVGSMVFTPTRRPLFTPKKHYFSASGTHFC